MDQTPEESSIERRSAASIVETPRWMARTALATSVMSRSHRIGRYAYRLAVAPIDSLALERFAPLAASLREDRSTSALSVGVTATGPGNAMSLSAISLATLWARWDYHTLLIDLSGKSTQIGRSLGRSEPSLAELFDAISDRRLLPAPGLLTSTLERLEAVGGLGHYSIAQLVDRDLLSKLGEALRDRYQRIVWSLPYLGPNWSTAPFLSIIDHFIVSARRARASSRKIESLTAQIADTGGNPAQLIWYD